MPTVIRNRSSILLLLAALAAAGCDPGVVAPADAGATPDAPAADTPAPAADVPSACPLERALTLPADSVSAALAGTSANRSTSCTTSTGTPGPEHVYPLHVGARAGVILTATADTGVELAVALRTRCDDALGELACEVTQVPLPIPGVPMEPPRARLATVLEPGDYVVLVDTIRPAAGAPYTLTLESFPPADNGTCASARAVEDGTLLIGESAEHGGHVRLECATSGGIDGPSLWYAVTVPARTRLRVTNTEGGMGMAVVSACAATSCLPATPRHPPAPAPAELDYDNATDAEVDVLVVIGSTGFPGAPPPFDLGVSLIPLGAAGSCDTALPLTPGVAVRGDAALGAAATGCAGGSTLFYTITVPPESVLRASLLPDSALGSPTVRLIAGSCDGACVGEVTAYPWLAMYRNAASTSIDLVVAVSAQLYSTLSAGFEMTATLEPMAPNRTCAAAAALPLDTLVAGDALLGAADRLGCDVTVERIGGAHYYRLDVPAGETLRISARGGSPAAMALFEGCAATCVARGGGDPTTLVYTNTSGAAREIVAAVGTVATHAFVPAPFEVIAQLGSVVPATSCAAPVPLAGDAIVLAEDASSGTDDLSALCVPESTTGTVYHSVLVPAGERLRATVRPEIRWLSGSWMATLRLLETCGETSCLASSPYVPYSDGQHASLAYENESAAARSLILAVSAAGGTTPARFDLDVSVAPPPYRTTAIAAACADVSGGEVVPLPSEPGPPSLSVRRPLPFPFAHFGTPVTHFLVSHDGYLQLQTTAGNVIASDGDPPVALPSGRAPRGIVAALWDELVAGATGRVRVATVGSAPARRFVVEWSGYRYAGDPSGGPLRFQIQLVEGSSAIELHYCAMGASAPPFDRGGRASIGTQDVAAADGVRVSFQAPAVDTGTAFRLAPP